MDMWTLGLYAMASCLSLRSLLSLMSRYEASHQQKRLIEELEKLQAHYESQRAKMADFPSADEAEPVTAGESARAA